MSGEGFPSFEEIYERVDQFESAHPDIARVESLGPSAENRPVKAVYVTDSSVPTEEKEVAVVICGRHGNERGTGVVGPALLDWLASEAGEETRRKQLVIVVPVANPDGCVRSEFGAPTDKLSDTEENTIAALAKAHQPDAVMDVHSWGDSDCEVVVTANTHHSAEDVFIHESIAAKMTRHAAARGYPFLIHRCERSGSYNNFYCGMCHEEFHSLVYGMEVNHGSLSPEESGESGVAAIEALLDEGNTRSPWQAAVGYPTRLILGDFFTSIRATGRNSAERRRSRCELWQIRKLFTPPQRGFFPDNTVRAEVEYSGGDLPCGFAFVCRLRGCPELKTVQLNGKDVEPTTYRDSCSTYVSIEIRPSGKEAYTLEIGL